MTQQLHIGQVVICCGTRINDKIDGPWRIEEYLGEDQLGDNVYRIGNKTSFFDVIPQRFLKAIGKRKTDRPKKWPSY